MQRPPNLREQVANEIESVPDLGGTHPLLWEHLSSGIYDDGSSRETSTLSVFVDGGTLKAALNDRQERRSLYVTAHGLRELLDALEVKLEGSDGDWRMWKGGSKRK